MSDDTRRSAHDGAADEPRGSRADVRLSVQNVSGAGNGGRHEVVIRRSPRYARFAFVGCGLGAVTAWVLTAAFPAAAPYTPFQVFGFLALIFGVAGGAFGAVIALILDRVCGRRRHRVIAGRIEANSTQT